MCSICACAAPAVLLLVLVVLLLLLVILLCRAGHVAAVMGSCTVDEHIADCVAEGGAASNGVVGGDKKHAGLEQHATLPSVAQPTIAEDEDDDTEDSESVPEDAATLAAAAAHQQHGSATHDLEDQLEKESTPGPLATPAPVTGAPPGGINTPPPGASHNTPPGNVETPPPGGATDVPHGDTQAAPDGPGTAETVPPGNASGLTPGGTAATPPGGLTAAPPQRGGSAVHSGGHGSGSGGDSDGDGGGGSAALGEYAADGVWLGRSRADAAAAEEGRARIAIVSNAVMQREEPDAADRLRRYNEFFANKQCYAETHGYDLIIDSRNHVEGMGFYVNADTGERGPTNVHFNKPYLIRKWLPRYDWVLWLDLDSMVTDMSSMYVFKTFAIVQPCTATNVHFNKPYLIRKWLPRYDWVLWLDLDFMVTDMSRRIETFIERLNHHVHILVPQDQNTVMFFSAYALLIRNSEESRVMVDDWFKLKDSCPFAMYDDQSRLYAALLRMQLRAANVTVDRSRGRTSDCLDVCERKETQKTFSWCFDRAIKRQGIWRLPDQKGPVAFSTLPKEDFRKGNDTGLAMQGMFGGIKFRPELVHEAFAVHVKPVCLKGAVTCAPFLDILIGEKYRQGMARCYGSGGWLADPVPALTALANRPKGPDADNEAELSKTEAVPALNAPFAVPFSVADGMSAAAAVTAAAKGPQVPQHGWRAFGADKDSKVCFAATWPYIDSLKIRMELSCRVLLQVCFAAPPAAGGEVFASLILEPTLEQLTCARSGNCGARVLGEAALDGTRHVTCLMSRVGQHFPYVLTNEYRWKFRYTGWTMTWLRDPVDRVLMAWLRSTAAHKARQEGRAAMPADVCIDGALDTVPPPPLPPTLEQYLALPGSDEVYTKFYYGVLWDSLGPWGDQCVGRAQKKHYRGGDAAFSYFQANNAAATLLEFQFVGLYEFWDASLQLLDRTLSLGTTSNDDAPPPPQRPSAADALARELPDAALRGEYERLRRDTGVRAAVEAHNPKDVLFYARAVAEFERRCRYMGVQPA
ncbi:hypothetical protein JKP88DRAFT_265920 [Tribonema minus]|uniref:Nucleotide-diphospho-sugar transferase domain-containing protein n=1 Tax=Tribonema minus TaxID=303371 RepID=A0A836C727_9STRA|nr:hypothetical protein JKP88DRAFT_265920 [Tribonema minus]